MKYKQTCSIHWRVRSDWNSLDPSGSNFPPWSSLPPTIGRIHVDFRSGSTPTQSGGLRIQTRSRQVPVSLLLIGRSHPANEVQKIATYSGVRPVHNPVDKESRPVPVPRLRRVRSAPVPYLIQSCCDCLEIQQTAPPHGTDSAGSLESQQHWLTNYSIRQRNNSSKQ